MIPKNLLPEAYRESYCVAGGWAACPALAQDMDVWVYAVPFEALELARTELLEHLEAENTKGAYYKRPFYVVPETQVENHRGTDQYEGVNVQILKVGRVEVRRESARLHKERKEIHLLVTDAHSPGEILQGFDVSTHAVAIDWNGIIWTHPAWTPPQMEPTVLMENEKTPVRMAKIRARFGHPEPIIVSPNQPEMSEYGESDVSL